MLKVAEIGKDAKTLIKEVNDTIIKEIEETQPDAIYMVYIKDGEMYYVTPSESMGVMQTLGALDFIKQSIYYAYLEGDD